jgi:hypothetical protein
MMNYICHVRTDRIVLFARMASELLDLPYLGGHD